MTTVRPHAAAAPGSKAEAEVSRAAEGAPEASPQEQKRRPVTLRTICKDYVLAGEKFACLTCYDATTAKWLERAGVPMLLVGDTAAEMILGYASTIHAPLDFLITLNAAVKRGAPCTFVMADMPFMSYQAEEAEGIRNAGRFMTEGMADAVKLEVDRSFTPLVEKMAKAGVPVVAHIGCRPQQAKLRGGYRSVGRTAEEAAGMVADAVAMEKAGAVMLLIEAAPNEVSARIVEKTNIPVIGCGAGPACHGQIVVLHDMLGLTDWQPAFARPLVAMGSEMVEAARQWIDKVRRSDLGEHPYRMKEGDAGKF
ncbi:MAG: 3-methyl-2-oxobutanoate hydroxymethyltransferase [Phycisphaerales bacterium]|nr:MAG: 3-methyl-2-oxobutanoate hydroxymethyltransferase [Phycisphaerales bacterium]